MLEILDAVDLLQRENRLPPTITELQGKVPIGRDTLYRHLRKLYRKRLLIRRKQRGRPYRISSKGDDYLFPYENPNPAEPGSKVKRVEYPEFKSIADVKDNEPMNVGMLWHDPYFSIPVSVINAFHYYQEKYELTANRAYVRDTMGLDTVSDNGHEIELVQSDRILPNHVWIGVSND